MPRLTCKPPPNSLHQFQMEIPKTSGVPITVVVQHFGVDVGVPRFGNYSQSLSPNNEPAPRNKKYTNMVPLKIQWALSVRGGEFVKVGGYTEGYHS